MNTHVLTEGDTKAVAEVGSIANLTEKELNDILKEVIAAREEVGQVYDRHSRACNTVEETGSISKAPSESRRLFLPGILNPISEAGRKWRIAGKCTLPTPESTGISEEPDATETKSDSGVDNRKRAWGRSSARAWDQCQAHVESFCNIIITTGTTMDFRPSARGWGYLLEDERVINKSEINSVVESTNDFAQC